MVMFSAFSIKYPNDNIDSFGLYLSLCSSDAHVSFHSANSNISMRSVFLLFFFYLFLFSVICSIVFYWHIERFSTQNFSFRFGFVGYFSIFLISYWLFSHHQLLSSFVQGFFFSLSLCVFSSIWYACHYAVANEEKYNINTTETIQRKNQLNGNWTTFAIWCWKRTTEYA